MLQKNFSKQVHHYLPLIGIFIAGVIGFSAFSFDKYFQAALAFAMCAGYFSWGLIHHYIHKDLYWEVAIEYLTIASLGLIILLSVIFRA